MIIDVHTHLAFGCYCPTMDADYLLALMDQAGIDMACLLPLESPEAIDDYLLTWQVVDICAKHPTRLIPFCCLDPRVAQDFGETRRRRYFVDRIRKSMELGCRGFGEHKPGLPADAAMSRMIYEICGELKLPLLLHIDNLRNYDMPAFERMVKVYANTVFIAHSHGPWEDIARLGQLLAKYPNLYVDTSPPGGSGGRALARDLDLTRRFLQEHFRKVLFGTDACCPGAELAAFDPQAYIRFFQELRLEPGVYQAIMGENARSLFRL